MRRGLDPEIKVLFTTGYAREGGSARGMVAERTPLAASPILTKNLLAS
jgi:hypothetical protein